MMRLQPVCCMVWGILCCLALVAGSNPVLLENLRTDGVASSEHWDINGAGDSSIQGFATDISAGLGETMKFKIKTPSDKYRVDIYRFGYYQGKGARLITTIRPHVPLPQNQPSCLSDDGTGLYDCSPWDVSASWKIPENAVSGVYLARPVREDESEDGTWRTDNSPLKADARFTDPGAKDTRPKATPHSYGAQGLGTFRMALKDGGRASHIYFIVRNDSSTAEFVFQTADATWQAYNDFGGRSTYGGFDPANPVPRCYKSSYNRPLATRKHRPTNAFLGVEYSMVRFLERFGFDVTYIAGVDADRYGSSLTNHQVFLSVGHDEYWSGQQRSWVEKARDAGVNLAFLSGNEMFWRIRWEDNYRTMVCYKETQSNSKIDPIQNEWTGTFRDPRSPLGSNPENAVTGTIFTVNAWRHDPLVVPAKYWPLRVWRNTSLDQHSSNFIGYGQEKKTYLRGVLGHEWDEDIDNGARPSGLIRLSETTVHNVLYVQDYGSVYDTGSATHHLVMYKARTRSGIGGLVFGAGTVQWAWALDNHHDNPSGLPAERMNPYDIRVGLDDGPNAPEVDLQQVMINVFGDMGVVGNTTLLSEAGLVPQRWKSSDTEGPTSVILEPRDGQSITIHDIDPLATRIADGIRPLGRPAKAFKLECESWDAEGVVAAMEYSCNEGEWWHPMNLHDQLYSTHTKFEVMVSVISCRQTTKGEITVFVRAVDDSLNLGPKVVVSAILRNGKHEDSKRSDDEL